jgi:hypothetical protein
MYSTGPFIQKAWELSLFRFLDCMDSGSVCKRILIQTNYKNDTLRKDLSAEL